MSKIRERHCGADGIHDPHTWGGVSTITGPYACPGSRATVPVSAGGETQADGETPHRCPHCDTKTECLPVAGFPWYCPLCQTTSKYPDETDATEAGYGLAEYEEELNEAAGTIAEQGAEIEELRARILALADLLEAGPQQVDRCAVREDLLAMVAPPAKTITMEEARNLASGRPRTDVGSEFVQQIDDYERAPAAVDAYGHRGDCPGCTAPGCGAVVTPSRRAHLRRDLANALVRYDWNEGLSGRDPPSEHHYGEADAVLRVLYAQWPWLRAEAEDAAAAAVAAGPDPLRERYAQAIRDGAERLEARWPYWSGLADAVLAVRDEELARLRAEVKRLGLMVDEYGTGAGALADKVSRVRDVIADMRATTGARHWADALDTALTQEN